MVRAARRVSLTRRARNFDTLAGAIPHKRFLGTTQTDTARNGEHLRSLARCGQRQRDDFPFEANPRMCLEDMAAGALLVVRDRNEISVWVFEEGHPFRAYGIEALVPLVAAFDERDAGV